MDRRFEQFRGIPEQVRQLSGKFVTEVHDLLFKESQIGEEVDLVKRRNLRLLVWGGLGLLSTGGIAASIYEQNKQQENPWEKLKKLGPDEIYYYSGTMTVGPEENLFTAPLEDPHSFVVFNANGTFKTKNAPVILSEKGYDPKDHSSVGVMAGNKGLLYATSQFVKVEGGSFRKARKTNDPNKFIDIETGAIISPEVAPK